MLPHYSPRLPFDDVSAQIHETLMTKSKGFVQLELRLLAAVPSIHNLQRKQRQSNFLPSVTLSGPEDKQFLRRFQLKKILITASIYHCELVLFSPSFGVNFQHR